MSLEPFTPASLLFSDSPLRNWSLNKGSNLLFAHLLMTCIDAIKTNFLITGPIAHNYTSQMRNRVMIVAKVGKGKQKPQE